MGRNKKKRSHNIGIDGRPAAHLPQEILLYNILTRVPGKSLNRFRCVCKQWNNLFDDRLYISLYSHYRSSQINDIDDSSACKERGLIYLKGHSYFVKKIDEEELTAYSFSFIDIDKKEHKEIPFRLPEGDLGDYIRKKYHYDDPICIKNAASVEILDSLNGLLLLRFCSGKAHRDRFYVYNPDTGCSVLIHRDECVSYDYLAYDPIISKYKVVGLCMNKCFCILTVGENIGHPRRCFPKLPYQTNLGIRQHVFVNHALHWIHREIKGTRSINPEEDYGEILGLDVSKEKVFIMKLPVKGSYASGRLLEMGGLLWFIHSVQNNNSELKLWYLNKNCNGGCRDGEWVVKCSINLADISLQQRISCNGRYFWNHEPPVIVTDPKCKLMFTFITDRRNMFGSYTKIRRYVYSYDMELKHWDLIHTGTDTQTRYAFKQKLHYWHDNKNALSTS